MSKNSGYVVKTKKGLYGHTLHSDSILDGKVFVYLDNGTKMMCNPDNLIVTGYRD